MRRARVTVQRCAYACVPSAHTLTIAERTHVRRPGRELRDTSFVGLDSQRARIHGERARAVRTVRAKSNAELR